MVFWFKLRMPIAGLVDRHFFPAVAFGDIFLITGDTATQRRF